MVCRKPSHPVIIIVLHFFLIKQQIIFKCVFSTAEIFDPDTGDWTRVADMPKPLMSAKVPNTFLG